MTYTVRYNVWVSMSDEEYEGSGDWDNYAAFDRLHKALEKIPGFIESSFEDSYED